MALLDAVSQTRLKAVHKSWVF